MAHKFEWMLVQARKEVMAKRFAEADTSKRGWQKAIAEELGVTKQYVSQSYMKYKEEQEMGGRGGGSGRGGGGGGATNDTLQAALKNIESKTFPKMQMGYSGIRQSGVGTAEIIEANNVYMVDVLDVNGRPVAGAGISFDKFEDAAKWGKSTLKKYAKEVLKGGKS